MPYRIRLPQSSCLALALALAALLAVPLQASGQSSAEAGRPAELRSVEISEPGAQILSFRHLSGTTVVQMRGTKIEPSARTRLKIQSRPGFLELDINRGDIKGLQPARRFGRDFLTYVLWAVSVDGEAANLGEITFEGRRPVSINVTTPYQTFWLMVTAEPDYAVNDPSPVVVLYSINQNSVTTTNKALPITGKLLYYTYYADYDTSPAAVVRGVPNELLQARKAVELAAASGVLASPTPEGEEPLPDELRTRETLEQARAFLQQAEEAFGKRGSRRQAIQFARTAAQIAENARALAVGAVGGIYVRQLERQLDGLRAELEKLRADVARMTPENDRLRAEADRARQAQQQAEQELARLRARLQQVEAELARERSGGEDALARARQAEAQLASLQDELARLRQALEQAADTAARLREERNKICAELRGQLASLGQLTQQGGSMILTLASDILFDFGSYELRPVARENLAKLAVLRLLLFPDAEPRYEGHTDLVGEEDYNQWLSEQRALAVYRYFLEETRQHEQDPQGRALAQQRLAAVETLLGMDYAAARRGQTRRLELLATLAEAVIGKGEREPVIQTAAAEERNRRVVLLFPAAQATRASLLCGEAGSGDQQAAVKSAPGR